MGTHYESLYIGGAWQPPSTAKKIMVISPSNEAIIGSVPEANEVDADAAVAAARRAFDDPSGWAHWEPSDRAEALARLANALGKRSEEMATRVSSQNGMPVTIARQLESAFPPILLQYYADLVSQSPDEEVKDHMLGGRTTVRAEPVGVVVAIAPWNFPQTLAAFKYAPALAAGCTVVLKPSPETVLDSFLLAEAVQEAGIPEGVINFVPGGREVGAHLVGHPDVDKVAFTGSTAAGRRIAETCGRLLRPVTLELGGKSAAIVLDDAKLDLQSAGDELFGATLLNNGQTCYLGTRVLAPRRRYDEVVDTFKALAESLTVGDALDPDTQIGPMVSPDHRMRVENYIAKGRGKGPRLITGGKRPQDIDKGWFLEPTVFADVDNSHAIAQEEIFGPVLAVIPYGTEDEAIRIANDSEYGLGGSVWTSDPDRGMSVARRVQTGTVGVNGYLPDPGSPFGGVKASGIGRELGRAGLSNYQHSKSIYH